jgi:hypothetical protein
VINAGVLAFVLFFFAAVGSAQPSPSNANDLVRQVVNNELQAENQDHSHWLYRLEFERPNGSRETDEVVETDEGSLRRPMLIDGHEPSPQEQQQADQYIRKAAQDPTALRKSLKQGVEDEARTQKMLKLLPEAFVFTYVEQQGDLVKLNFAPNPQFHPPSREAEVFHALQGCLWVHRKQNRLAEISGRLVHKVKFGGGLLGHLDEGGSFDVKQAELTLGYWKLSQLNVHMTGRVLFFKTISQQHKEARSNFKRLPDNITVAQAADLLEKRVTSQLRTQRRTVARR